MSPQPPGTSHGPVLTCGHEGVFGCPCSHPSPRGLGAGALRLLLLLLVELGGRGGQEQQRAPVSPQNTPRGTQSPHTAARAPQHSRAPPYWHSEPLMSGCLPTGQQGRGPSARDTPQPQRGGRRGPWVTPAAVSHPQHPICSGQERRVGVTQRGREGGGSLEWCWGQGTRARQDSQGVRQSTQTVTLWWARGHQGTPRDRCPEVLRAGGPRERQVTHLVQVDGVKAHLGRGHLGQQRRAAQAAQPRLTQRRPWGTGGAARGDNTRSSL